MSKGLLDCIAPQMEDVDAVIDGICESGNAELTEMCRYVLSNHGKRLRPAVTLLSFYALGGTDTKSAVNIASAIEVVHNSTLIHDDINDSGELRRGAKALYRQYSLSKSIVAGDYLYAMSFRLMGTTNQEIIDFVLDAAIGLAGGEFDQRDYEHNVSVDEANYIKIIGGKTARLFEASAKCGAYLAAPDRIDYIEGLGSYAFYAGHAFQIVDDILDVAGDTGSTGKAVGNDLIDGKPTAPVIYAMQDPVYGDKVRAIFESDNTTHDDAMVAIGYIKQTDAIERCFDLARHYVDKAKEAIADIPDSEYKQCLYDIVDFIITRDR